MGLVTTGWLNSTLPPVASGAAVRGEMLREASEMKSLVVVGSRFLGDDAMLDPFG